MKRRMVITLAAMILFLVVIGLVKFLQIKAAIAQGGSWQAPPEAVTTAIVQEEQWPSTISAIGTVAAVHGVTVSADLPGIVERISFDSGKSVRAGQELVRLDTRQERAQLTQAEAQRDLADVNFKRLKTLLDQGAIAQADFDQGEATAKEAEARVGEIQATISRKVIRAPFTGVLGIRQVNLGQYLEGGAAIVPLQSMDPVYVNFSVPQQDVARLHIGAEVHALADSIPSAGPAGKVTAINSVVDEETRNVQIQATFQNPHTRLRPGMYVQVETGAGASGTFIALPASAVSYAPYGNSVYVVSDLKGPKGKSYKGVQQRFVKLGESRGDQVAVVSGLKPGDEVVTSGVFKLREGAAVYVNNAVRPGNNPTPKPENS